MNIQFLDSQVLPLSRGNGSMLTSTNREQLIDRYFTCVDEPESNQQRIRPRSTGMSTNGPEDFKHLHKCKSQAKGLVDLVLPSYSYCGNGSPKSATQFPTRGGGNGHRSDKVANNNPKNGKRSTSRSSFPFSSLPNSTSRSIPIASSSLKRTASELQLLEDEAMAEYRDFCMYMRIVNGMNERCSWTKFPSFNGEIQNIIRTRHNPVEEGPSSYMREGLERHSVNSPLNPPKAVRTAGTAPTLVAPSLAPTTELMTPCYNYSTRKPRRTPAIVIQEPTDDCIDDLRPNVDCHEESDGVFVMDDV